MALHTGNAASGNNDRSTQCRRVGAEAKGFDRIDTISNAAHQYNLNTLTRTDFLQRLERLNNGRQRRNTHVVNDLRTSRSGRALHTIEFYKVESVLGCDLDVVANSPGTELNADRQTITRGFTQFLNLNHQVVGPQDVRMPRR